jgi:hypothetical protein
MVLPFTISSHYVLWCASQFSLLEAPLMLLLSLPLEVVRDVVQKKLKDLLLQFMS